MTYVSKKMSILNEEISILILLVISIYEIYPQKFLVSNKILLNFYSIRRKKYLVMRLKGNYF